MKTFRIRLNAKDKKEADFRIKDNEKRGFKLVSIHENPIDSKLYSYKTHSSTMTSKRKLVGTEYKNTYLIIMEKENENKEHLNDKIHRHDDKSIIKIINNFTKDKCIEILSNYKFKDILPDNNVLSKSIYNHFNMHPQSTSAKLKGLNRQLLGDDFIRFDYQESKIYKAELFRKYEHKLDCDVVSILTLRGAIKLLYIMNKIKETDLLVEPRNSPNKRWSEEEEQEFFKYMVRGIEKGDSLRNLYDNFSNPNKYNLNSKWNDVRYGLRKKYVNMSREDIMKLINDITDHEDHDISSDVENNSNVDSNEVVSIMNRILDSQKQITRDIELLVERLNSNDATEIKKVKEVRNLSMNFDFTIDKKGNVIYN